MSKSNRNIPIVFYVGLLLVCLTFFSVHMSSGLYARYASTVSGSGSARVARIDLSHTVITQDASVELNFYDPNKMTDTVEFQVASDSEVTMIYDVIVTLPAGEYSWLAVTLDGQSGTLEGNKVTFSDVKTITASDTTVYRHELQFSILQAYAGNLNGYSDVNGQIQITVHAEQID